MSMVGRQRESGPKHPSKVILQYIPRQSNGKYFFFQETPTLASSSNLICSRTRHEEAHLNSFRLYTPRVVLIAQPYG